MSKKDEFLVDEIINWFNWSSWTFDMIKSKKSVKKMILDFADETKTDLSEFDIDSVVEEVYLGLTWM